MYMKHALSNHYCSLGYKIKKLFNTKIVLKVEIKHNEKYTSRDFNNNFHFFFFSFTK